MHGYFHYLDGLWTVKLGDEGDLLNVDMVWLQVKIYYSQNTFTLDIYQFRILLNLFLFLIRIWVSGSCLRSALLCPSSSLFKHGRKGPST